MEVKSRILNWTHVTCLCTRDSGPSGLIGNGSDTSGAARKWVTASLRAELPLGLTTSLSLETVGPGLVLRETRNVDFRWNFLTKHSNIFLKAQFRPNKTHPLRQVGPWATRLHTQFSFGDHPDSSSGPVGQTKHVEHRWTSPFQFCCLLAPFLKGLVREAIDRGKYCF